MAQNANLDDAPDGLRTGADAALEPLFVWSAHFAFCYAWPLFACGTALGHRHIAGLSPAPAGLIVASALGVGWLGWRVVHAALAVHRGQHGMVDTVRLGAGALALVALLWNVLAMLFVPACG